MSGSIEMPLVDQELGPAESIAKLMNQRISNYLAARNDPSLYQSVRNMSQFVSDDYGNRFLVELIQNAHDAHDPTRTDGEIAVVLDITEGHGCLYVANRGAGFTGKNLQAITNIALSSKPVNAGIGNKGLGFRSVLQVCSWPEIYSVRGEGGGATFDGLCFRFATIDDLRAHKDVHSADASQEMASNLPCWHIPVLTEPDDKVTRFAEAGFATVVRLPLKSLEALQSVRAQIDVLMSLSTPLQLFLDRVGRISIDSGMNEPFVLERSVEETWPVIPKGLKVDSPITVAKLCLGNARFVAAHWDIDDQLFRQALHASLEREEIPESWRDWDGIARISIAVPLGAPLEMGRLYCFLPLGAEGKAPFCGYINANFYTKMDRRTVDVSIGLNEFFMRTAAWLSCQLIDFMVKSGWAQAPSAVVSLLCWDEAYQPALKLGMGDDGQGILNREFLPVRGNDETISWASPKETYSWIAPGNACLSTKAICEIGGGKVLVDSLTLSQRAALDRLYIRLRQSDFKPPAKVISGWIEAIAVKMHEQIAAPERWADFYDEVSTVMADHASYLSGKKFLLSVSGDLISSELPANTNSGRSRRAADVYFAPVLSVDADVDDEASKRALPLDQLPATLRKGFALLSRDIPWLKDDGGHRPGRSFLIAGKLAREYDTRDVLRTLAGVTRSSVPDRTREQALEWAFRLWSSGRSLSDKETRSADFFVPTANDWVDAKTAMFGAGWEVPNGSKLQALLRITADDSDDMKVSLARLVPEFVAWPIRYGTQSEWVRFLNASGVVDCLRPIGGESITANPIGFPALLPLIVTRDLPGITETLRSHWKAQITQDCSQMYFTRNYRAEMRPWRIPGQGECESFPPDVRRDFAVQVALAMRSFSDEHRTFRAVRTEIGNGEVHRLSTPLIAFLTGAQWLPVIHPGGKLRFVKPSDAWYFNSEEERPPRFVEFVAHQVAVAIDSQSLEWLQREAKFGLFNNELHAGRALLALIESASGGISDIRDVRRFQEWFRRLWIHARKKGTPEAGTSVPVRIGNEIRVLTRTIEEDIEPYFDDERDGVKKQLLEEVGEPIFDFVPGDTAAVWGWVNNSVPQRFRLISDEPAEVYVDGIRFDDRTPSRLLSDVIGSWFVEFLVCVAEHKSSVFMQSTQRTLGRIRRAALSLEVVSGQKIQIAHGNKWVPMPLSLRGSLVLNRAAGPVLIIQAEQEPLTLEHVAGASAQLAVALGARDLANGLDAALLRLASTMRNGGEETPDDTILASALGVEPEAIRQTRLLVSGDLIGMLHLAIPLSACKASPQTTARLQELSTQSEPQDEDLRAVFEALAFEVGIPLANLEARMIHLADLSDLKVEFLLPIAQLNEAIAVLGDQYELASNEHMHREAWMRHLRLQQTNIIERLRERSFGLFDKKLRLDAYIAAREGVLAIAPQPTWFTTYDELPAAVMDTQIDSWIDGAMPASASDSSMDLTLTECRASNGAKLRNFLTHYAPILSAWVRAGGITGTLLVRQTWSTPEAARDTCTAHARDCGWLDFRLLDDGEIVQWLSQAGIWPVGKAASKDLTYWGLSAESMVSNEERAKNIRLEQQRRRMQVEFDGVSMSAITAGYIDIAAAVVAAAAQAPALNHVSSKEATLQTIDFYKTSGTSGGGGNGSMPKLSETSMSDEQKLAVGLMGELWAREWLRRRHKLESVDESIWVSRYRDAVLNTSGGSDSLGYDFIVATKSRTYYYEVKASSGNPLRFELGPTEIFAAQRYRGDSEHKYRILYLANVGDPARMTPTLLANPFSSKGAGTFRAVGKGSVVYEFNPK